MGDADAAANLILKDAACLNGLSPVKYWEEAVAAALADARRGMREEAAGRARFYATGYMGLDPVFGATLEALAKDILALPVEAWTTDERTKALEEIALMDADEIMALPDAPPATGEGER